MGGVNTVFLKIQRLASLWVGRDGSVFCLWSADRVVSGHRK